MRTITWVLLVLMIPVTAAAQGRGPDQARRAELEQRIRHRFLATVAERLDLTEAEREQVREVMADGAEARRELALDAHALRVDLIQAVRDDDAPVARFEAILERLESVRAREREIEQQEEAALAEFLDPRQRAVLLMIRMQLNDRVRQMRGRGGPMGGPPSDAGGPGLPGGPGMTAGPAILGGPGMASGPGPGGPGGRIGWRGVAQVW